MTGKHHHHHSKSHTKKEHNPSKANGESKVALETPIPDAVADNNQIHPKHKHHYSKNHRHPYHSKTKIQPVTATAAVGYGDSERDLERNDESIVEPAPEILVNSKNYRDGNKPSSTRRSVCGRTTRIVIVVTLSLLVVAGITLGLVFGLRPEDPSCDDPLTPPLRVKLVVTTGNSRLNKSDQEPFVTLFPSGLNSGTAEKKAMTVQLTSLPLLGETQTYEFPMADTFQCGVSRLKLQTDPNDENEMDGWMFTELKVTLSGSKGEGGRFDHTLGLTDENGGVGVWLDGKPYDDLEYYDDRPFANGWEFEVDPSGKFPSKAEHETITPPKPENGDDIDCAPPMASCDPWFSRGKLCCSGLCYDQGGGFGNWYGLSGYGFCG
jgi:hypothetical protein